MQISGMFSSLLRVVARWKAQWTENFAFTPVPLRVTPCFFFCCSRYHCFLFILRFESYFSDVRWCKNLVVSWCARPSLVTVRHRVSQSRADRWQRLGSQFVSLIHHPWSFSQVLRDVGISRLSMFLSHPSTLSVWHRWKHHLIFEKTNKSWDTNIRLDQTRVTGGLEAS